MCEDNSSKLGEEVYLTKEDIAQLRLTKNEWIIHVTNNNNNNNSSRMYYLLYNTTNLLKVQDRNDIHVEEKEFFKHYTIVSPIVNIYAKFDDAYMPPSMLMMQPSEIYYVRKFYG